MEGLVDPRVFESPTGFLVGVALLVMLVAAILVGYISGEPARRKQRASERPAGTAQAKERTRRAA